MPYHVVRTVDPHFNEVPRDWENWFILSRFFSIQYTITGLENIVCYTEDVLYLGLLNQGST